MQELAVSPRCLIDLIRDALENTDKKDSHDTAYENRLRVEDLKNKYNKIPNILIRLA